MGSGQAITIAFEPDQERRIRMIVDHRGAVLCDVRSTGPGTLAAVIRKP